MNLHIEVVHYKGKNGSYARERIWLWLARIVGVNERKRNCDQSTWHGYSNRDYTMGIATNWAELLGCPIVEVEGDEQVSGGPPP
jgi:hypothetical protein